MAKQALIVIDIQNDYFPNGKWPLVGVEAAADNAARLIQAFRDSGQQVVHIRHEFTSDSAPFFTPAPAAHNCTPRSATAPTNRWCSSTSSIRSAKPSSKPSSTSTTSSNWWWSAA